MWPVGLLGRPLAFDVGLFNGRDSLELLRSGHRVVAVEANPVMYKRALKTFSKFIEAGELKLVHGVLKKGRNVEAGQSMPFYVHKETPEWSSLMKSVGCRKSYQESHKIDMSKCDEIQVDVVSCAGILQKFGSPYYMKLDIEGHEMSCLQELEELSKGSNGRLGLPQYISMEVNKGTTAFLPSMVGLGYGRVKMVDQSSFGDWSGPYGEVAKDIKTGYGWNDIASYTKPKCNSWCDFHVNFGPSQQSPLDQRSSEQVMEQEVSILAKAVGLE